MQDKCIRNILQSTIFFKFRSSNHCAIILLLSIAILGDSRRLGIYILELDKRKTQRCGIDL